MGEIKFIVGLTMVALFVIAIVSYVVSFSNDNNAPVNLDNEEGFDSLNTQVQGNISHFVVEDVNDSQVSFFPSEITPGDDVMNSGNTFKVGLWSLLGAILSINSLIRTYLFGGSAALNIFLTALYSLLLFIGIRYIYKSWVGKNPD